MIVILLLSPVALLLPIAGVGLVVRARRMPRHFCCAACGYDLSGHAGSEATCPECGSHATGGDPVGRFRRRHNLGVALIIVGSVLALPILGLMVLGILGTVMGGLS